MASSHLGSPFLSCFLAQDIPLPFVWPVGSSQFQQEGHAFPRQIRCNFVIHFSWITLIVWDTFNYFCKRFSSVLAITFFLTWVVCISITISLSFTISWNLVKDEKKMFYLLSQSFNTTRIWGKFHVPNSSGRTCYLLSENHFTYGTLVCRLHVKI